ncbi:hypothetical protein GQ53DRAFT_851026 [Thozetella sp. PMI_491]|nr:hypothetical protein GQ53DRAFT_851026 [Thozetella sp. PMI_491]
MSAAQQQAARSVVADIGITILSRGGSTPSLDKVAFLFLLFVAAWQTPKSICLRLHSLVFVHGLGGHPQKTFSTDPHSPKASAEPRPSRLSTFGAKLDKAVKGLVPGKSKKQARVDASSAAEAAGGRATAGEPSSVAENTGTADSLGPDASPPKKIFWPLDLVGADFQDVRVMTFGYDSSPSHSTQNNLYTLSKNLLSRLAAERESCPNRPLVFVCHSLGGILTKFALKLAQDSSGAEAEYQQIRSSTWGVVFFGTPHSGSDRAAWGETLRRIAGVFKVTSSPLLAALDAQNDDGQLESLRDSFAKMLGPRSEGKLIVHSFRETAPLSSALPSVNPASSLIVPLASSHIASDWARNPTIDGADHLSICKFGGFDDPTYRLFQSALKDYLKRITDAPVADLSQQMTSLELDVFRHEVGKCLETLNFTRSKKVRKPTAGTFAWIWDEPQFKAWQYSEAGPLWIRGKAGSGKSTLMQHLFETEKSRLARESPNTMVLFFSFFSQAHGPESSMKGLLRSLLYQMIQANEAVARPVLDAWRGQISTKEPSLTNHWDDLDQLKELFITTLTQGPGKLRLSIYVDALNECREFGEVWSGDLQFLLESVSANGASDKFQAKVIISSQPTARLTKVFEASRIPTMVLEEHNLADISRYIEHQVRPFEPLDPEFQTIIHRIQSKADGVFLWVMLMWENYLSKLVEKRSVHGEYVAMSELESILSGQHEKLDETYRYMLGTVDANRQTAATVILKLLLCTPQPLSLAEFRYALALGSPSHSFKTEAAMFECTEFPLNDDDVEKQIKSKTGGLAEVKRHEVGGRTVQFIHDSAKEYVLRLSKEGPIFTACTPGENGHVYLARACTNYLSLKDIAWLQYFYGRMAPSFYHAVFMARMGFSFFRYAITYWLHHVKEAEAVTQSSQAVFLLSMPALHLSMYHGLGETISQRRGWLDFWVPWTTIRGWRDNRENVVGLPGPLCVAVSCRLLLSAKKLLAMDIISPDESGGFPIQCAAMADWYDMMVLLMEHGARVRHLSHEGSETSLAHLSNPVRVWLAIDKHCIENAEKSRVLEMMLERGLERPHSQPEIVGSTLSLSMFLGNDALTQRLVESAQESEHFDDYITRSLQLLMVLALEYGMLDDKFSKSIGALLAPLVSSSSRERVGIWLGKALALGRSLRARHLESEGEDGHAGDVAGTPKEGEAVGWEKAGFDRLMIILYRYWRSLDSAAFETDPDGSVLDDFLKRYTPSDPPILVINRDGPVMGDDEVHFFVPRLTKGRRRMLLQDSSPIFHGRNINLASSPSKMLTQSAQSEVVAGSYSASLTREQPKGLHGRGDAGLALYWRLVAEVPRVQETESLATSGCT